MTDLLTSNLISRLRKARDPIAEEYEVPSLFIEAADEIKRLTAERERLTESYARETHWARGEIERLRAALQKSADIFADFNKGLRLLNRPLLADACEIAEKAARDAISGVETSEQRICLGCGKPYPCTSDCPAGTASPTTSVSK